MYLCESRWEDLTDTQTRLSALTHLPHSWVLPSIILHFLLTKSQISSYLEHPQIRSNLEFYHRKTDPAVLE